MHRRSKRSRIWGTYEYREAIEHRASNGDPAKTSVQGTHRVKVTLDERELLWEAELTFSSDRKNFYYDYTRRLFEDGELLREKNWTDSIPRDHQ